VIAGSDASRKSAAAAVAWLLDPFVPTKTATECPVPVHSDDHIHVMYTLHAYIRALHANGYNFRYKRLYNHSFIHTSYCCDETQQLLVNLTCSWLQGAEETDRFIAHSSKVT
jgi:hypothetical protein